MNFKFHFFHFQIVDQLTNNYNYEIVVDSMPMFKFQRVVTEFGICDTFNSELSQFLDPSFLIASRMPLKQKLFEINYLDVNTFILVNNLADSDVCGFFNNNLKL